MDIIPLAVIFLKYALLALAGGSLGWSVAPAHQEAVGLIPSQAHTQAAGLTPKQLGCP